MRVDELLRYDIPQAVVDLWRGGVCETLLPVQEQAVKRHGLFGGRNLLVQAPTSSGKTFVGEMAAIQTALRQKQVVYLVPLKALAEEKFAEFHRRYTDYGLRVILSTRDHRERDGDLERGNFDVAVVVYEKLAQLLVRRPERVAEIDLAVADELEILSDPERGAGAELLLTRLLQARCRVIGLSAVIGGADRLAAWMEADLLQSDQRPVALRYGVLYEGDFHYRTANGLEGGVESLAEGCGESAEDAALENLALFAARGERSLVFVRAKHDTRAGAERVAARLDLPPASAAIAALEALEPTRSRDALRAVMARGVAFHNADLSPAERAVVEGAFRAGEVLALVSTGTLAVGLNLPARNVFLTTEKWRYDHDLGMPWKTPLSHMEYENMGGRAGRLGMGHDYGRAILVAVSPFEKELCWRRYVEGEREAIEPQLDRAPLEDHVLRLVASGQCRTLAALGDFLERSLTGRWVWAETCPLDEIVARIRAAVHRCVTYGMIAAMPERENGPLAATPVGHAVAGTGVGIETAVALQRWAGASRERPWCDADVLFAAASTPDGRMTQVLLTAREYDEAGYVAELRDRTRHEQREGDLPLAQLCAARLQPFFEEVRATKVTLFLLDWLDQVPIYTIEERYNTMSGQIIAAAAQLSWLIDAIRAIATAEGQEGPFTDRLERLAARLPLGVWEELVPLVRAGGPGLSRREAIALGAQGFGTVEALATVPEAVLAEYLPPEKARSARAWASARHRMDGAVAVGEKAAAQTARPRLIVDDGRPNEIALDEHKVPLQRKQFELIRLLAGAPGECIRYETIYDTLWDGVCVEQSQMHYQKRTLLQRIREACPGGEKDLITTRNRYGYALNLPPESVVLRRAREIAPG